MKLFVWILRKESVLFEQVTKHAQKYVLKKQVALKMVDVWNK